MRHRAFPLAPPKVDIQPGLNLNLTHIMSSILPCVHLPLRTYIAALIARAPSYRVCSSTYAAADMVASALASSMDKCSRLRASTALVSFTSSVGPKPMKNLPTRAEHDAADGYSWARETSSTVISKDLERLPLVCQVSAVAPHQMGCAV